MIKNLFPLHLYSSQIKIVRFVGLDYDYKTGYYYDAEKALYYDGSTGTYFKYNQDTKEYLVIALYWLIY